jgi:predicted Zn-ribbon and HTH transcriptional regulator
MRYSYSVSENIPHKWQISSKYAFLFTPPEIIDSNGEGTTASIDILRLLVQCAVVILAGGGLSFFYGRYLAKLKLIADKQNNNQEMLIKNSNREMVIINKNLLNKTVENTDTKTEKLHIVCPQCHKRLFGATRAMVGETGICPKCKAEFIIEDKHMQDIFSGRYSERSI